MSQEQTRPLSDIIVYGRRTGMATAKRAADLRFKNLTLGHLDRFHDAQKAAGITPKTFSPILFPDYVNREHEGGGVI